ncbi:DUF4011 domain-containing protein [Bradyrhizobium sp. 33ap4]|uniref:DUF4011 domain-containing protein n=1 Tax=Bradyrhizobium sp. 33ap4 TaxID=3061630 RepID=UPI00292ECE2B|nr:DUF4011 domain-containing protein [Bradyrhizobium sp. 33ap4]
MLTILRRSRRPRDFRPVSFMSSSALESGFNERIRRQCFAQLAPPDGAQSVAPRPFWTHCLAVLQPDRSLNLGSDRWRARICRLLDQTLLGPAICGFKGEWGSIDADKTKASRGSEGVARLGHAQSADQHPAEKNIRAIEIVDEKTSEVFRLLAEGKRFTFLPAEQASEESATSNTLAQPAETGIQARHTDKRLQTKLSLEALQKRLLDIWTLEEEQGVNILYLALGLLKWFEDDKSDVERLTPLVLLPVRLERSSAADRFHLVSRSEPPSPNLSLQAKTDGEFGLKDRRLQRRGRRGHRRLPGERRGDRFRQIEMGSS